MKYFRFHKDHNHNIDDCIQLKDNIEGLIKRGYLFEYVKGNDRGREESPKSKSSSKVVDVVTNREGTDDKDKEARKGKV